jgi:AcrR family transcriptional regulator
LETEVAEKIRTRARNDPEVRREQILEEAIRIIGQRGYYGFTVQELAQRCGLTNGGLLYHFGSKEQLLIAVLEERNRRNTEIVISALPPSSRRAARSGLSWSATLEILRAIAAQISAQPELTRLYTVLQSEALDRNHPAYAYFQAFEAKVMEAFTTLVAPHFAEPRSTARQLIALMDGLALRWFRADQAFDLLKEWDRAVAMLVPNVKRARRGK